jgi:hypothetical protein
MKTWACLCYTVSVKAFALPVQTLRLLAVTGLTTLTGFQANAIVVTPTGDALTLVNTLLGAGVTVVGVPSLTGGNLASNLSSAATFTGGLTTGIGINSGVLLTSGYASNVGNSNTSDAITGNFGGAGDADLTALSGFQTFDATILTFDFTTTTGNLFFNFAFGSDEYNEFANSSVNDVFGFFVDGTNIALLPGTNTPISINTVNGGNPFGNNPQNPQFFNNNDIDDGSTFAFEYDGFTDVFTVSALNLDPNVNHTIRLAISDAGDRILDSGVFIQAGSFTPVPPPPPNGVPDGGSSLVLAGLGAMLLGSLKRLRKS